MNLSIVLKSDWKTPRGCGGDISISFLAWALALRNSFTVSAGIPYIETMIRLARQPIKKLACRSDSTAKERTA